MTNARKMLGGRGWLGIDIKCELDTAKEFGE